MKNNNISPTFKTVLSFGLFSLLFLILVILAGILAFFLQPNLNGLGGIIFSLICATPLAFSLFVVFLITGKFKWYITYILPVLIFPFLISLFLGYTAFEQRPTNIFRIFVADPIPVGVSDIQARDISIGIDPTIIVAFKATEEAIDEIIRINKFVLVDESNMVNDPEYELLNDIEWNEQWVTYEYEGDSILITMWIGPDNNTVLLRWIGF